VKVGAFACKYEGRCLPDTSSSAGDNCGILRETHRNISLVPETIKALTVRVMLASFRGLVLFTQRAVLSNLQLQ
jgi:hypothetical protein